MSSLSNVNVNTWFPTRRQGFHRKNKIALLLLAVAISPLQSRAQREWRRTSAAAAGFDAVKLDAVQHDLARRRTTAFLVVRHGRIVCEWYAPGQGPETLQGTASLAKALVGGLSLLSAMNEGRIKPDDLASKYIPFWKSDPLKKRITIRELATHTSGIEDAEEHGIPHNKLAGWKGAFWRRDPNPFVIAVRQAPVLFEPGTAFEYSNPGMAALSYAITVSLRGTPLSDIKALLRERIMQPLGIRDSEWSIGYGRPYDTDRMSMYANWGGAAFTARSTAKLGLLMLRHGEWRRRQLIAREWVNRALVYAGTPIAHGPLDKNAPASGLCWWINTNGGWEGLPKDAFGGAGAGHQMLLVVPSLDLIVVRNGQALDAGNEAAFWPPLVHYVMQPVVEAIAEHSVY